jgi:hypothetical protein
MDRNQELDRYYQELVERYTRETGGQDLSPEKVEAWLKMQGPIPPAVRDALEEEYVSGAMEQLLSENPDGVSIRTVKSSGEEAVLWSRRTVASPEFLAEADRQAREDWAGDCPPYEVWANKKR